MSSSSVTNAGRRAWIIGAAHALPPRVVRNEDLPASLGVDAAGVFKRTGIRARHWADRGTYTSDLGAEAARKVFEETGIDPASIDCLIAATQTADHFIPGIGVIIQAKLGLTDIPCFDIRDQCSGFLYALQVAKSFIETNTYSRILVVCAELLSHGLGLEPTDAHITPLFADGAAAVIVTAESRGNPPLTPIWQTLGADGRGVSRLRHRLWDISLAPPWDPPQFSEPARNIQYAEMDGEAVFRAAVRAMVACGKACFDSLGIKPVDIDWFLPHQANASINKTVASILRIPPERVLGNIERVANCSGASLPILLSETLKDGKIEPGQRLLMVAFGAGYTWGATVLDAAP
jgi:3-oxoacyl-[acyl-carrier-protein] synthase-3